MYTKFKLFLVLALSTLSLTSWVHAEAPLAGPAYEGVVEAVIDGHRKPLERLSGIYVSRIKSRFIGGTETGYDFEGLISPIRLAQGTDVAFIARYSGNLDPSQTIKMFRMKPGRDSRMVVTMVTGNMFQANGRLRNSQIEVPLAFEPYKRDFMKIMPVSPLKPGEYIVTTQGVPLNGFGFGVDEGPSTK